MLVHFHHPCLHNTTEWFLPSAISINPTCHKCVTNIIVYMCDASKSMLALMGLVSHKDLSRSKTCHITHPWWPWYALMLTIKLSAASERDQHMVYSFHQGKHFCISHSVINGKWCIGFNTSMKKITTVFRQLQSYFLVWHQMQIWLYRP